MTEEKKVTTLLQTSSENMDTVHSNDTPPDDATEQLNPKKTVIGHESRLKGISVRRTVIMTACFINHIVVVGFISALGVIYVELISAFDSLRTKAALVQSLYFGITVCGGIVFTKLVQHYGSGLCVAVGMTFAAISVFISIFSINIYMIIVFVGVLSSFGTSITFMCDFIAVSWAFKKNRKTALACLTIASTVGQVSCPLLAESLLERYFWNGTLMIFSSIILHGLPLGLLVHFSDQSLQDTGSKKDEGARPLNYLGIFKSLHMILVILIMLIIDIGGAVEYYFTVDLSVMRGFSRQTGASLLSLLGFASLFGRITGTVLLAACVNIGATFHYTYSLMVFGVAYFLVIYIKEYTGMLVGVLLQGFSTGLTVSVFPGFLIEQLGTENFPIAIASTNVISGVFDIMIGFCGGLAADMTGGYELMYYIAAGSCAAGAVVTSIFLSAKRAM